MYNVAVFKGLFYTAGKGKYLFSIQIGWITERYIFLYTEPLQQPYMTIFSYESQTDDAEECWQRQTKEVYVPKWPNWQRLRFGWEVDTVQYY